MRLLASARGCRMAGAALTRRDVLRLTPLAGAALAVGGCGYALAGRGNTVPDYIRIIGVPMFGNRTPFSPLEQIFTEKVRVELQGRGSYQVLPVDTGVDGVVRGDILNVGAAPVGFNNTQQASRYRFTIVVSVSFSDVKLQKTVWENPALSFSDEYELTSASSLGLGAAGIQQESAAVDRLSSDFARSVVSAILEAF
jgi:Lipopolysaccharide-assembly